MLSDDFIRDMCENPERIFDPNHDTNRSYLLEELRRHSENAVFFASRSEFETINEQQFTRQYLFNAESSLYSDQSSLGPDLECVLNMIHDCGGLAFLAHVFLYSDNVLKRLDEFCGNGTDGLECWYGTFTNEQKVFLSDFCDECGLYKSGGSDYHGPGMRAQNVMGYSGGDRILMQPWMRDIKNRYI